MKIYVGVTGALFGLVTLIHIWRMVEEGPRMAEAPWYILITATTAALCVWGFWLLRRR